MEIKGDIGRYREIQLGLKLAGNSQQLNPKPSPNPYPEPELRTLSKNPNPNSYPNSNPKFES